jgi:hypothetical protein
MQAKQDTWCCKELSSVELSDKRLNRRLLKVANDLLNHPDAPIHEACSNWSGAKAAYRLFDNDKLDDVCLMNAHRRETLKRIAESNSDVIFAIQDTTTLNYTHHPKKQRIHKINQNPGFDKPSKGFFLHNTLAMTEDALPLGLLEQKIYQHNPADKVSNKRRPIHEKESYRWIEALQLSSNLVTNKTVVTIADRESDIFELFFEASKLNTQILIRAAHDRILNNEGKESQTIWKKLEATPIAGHQTLDLPARHNQPKRLAHLEIRHTEIVLKPPQRSFEAKADALEKVTLQAIWLYEPNPPEKTTPLEWMLLTNVNVLSLEDALKMGRWYRLRWQIECYHRVLKSGCNVEDCRLETYERLKKYIRLKSVIAFRLLWLTMINRINPNDSCDKILQDHEWKSLCCHIFETSLPPKKPPTVYEAVRMIAKLGGFLGRKGDKEPGMSYIWRGWEKLALIAEFWQSLTRATCG